MRFIRSLILPVVLIALLLLGLFTAMDYFAALETAEAPELPAAPEELPPETATEQREEPADRLVNPELFGQPFTRGDVGLTRVEPRAPLSPQPKPEADEAALLHRPTAMSAGSIAFTDRNLRLAGLKPTPVDRTCENVDGSEWPCGTIARTAFRNYLRGRSLECDVPDGDWQETAVATCTLGDDDVAAWLARNGWAEAEPGSAYADLVEDARRERRGIFGDDPRRR